MVLTRTLKQTNKQNQGPYLVLLFYDIFFCYICFKMCSCSTSNVYKIMQKLQLSFDWPKNSSIFLELFLVPQKHNLCVEILNLPVYTLTLGCVWRLHYLHFFNKLRVRRRPFPYSQITGQSKISLRCADG